MKQTPPATQAQKFRILLLNAMTRPMAAAVVAITIVVALWIGYWFFLVGTAFYAFIVYSSLQDTQESKRALDDVLYPQRKIDLGKLIGSYRDALQRALDTRKKIEAAVAQTDDPGIHTALVQSTGDLDELTGTIYDLALKAQSLQSSLQSSNIDISLVNSDVMRLQNLVKNSQDAFAKSQYQATLDGKRQQLQNYHDITDALSRWNAQLDNALSTLDTIFSQVLRIRSSQVLSLSSATDQVSKALRAQVDELKATSDALDSVYGASK